MVCGDRVRLLLITISVYTHFAYGQQSAQLLERNADDQHHAGRVEVIRQKLLSAASRLKQIDSSVRQPQNEVVLHPAIVVSKEQRDLVAAELESWKKAAARLDAETICGPLDDSVDVEKYVGNLGPTKAFVNQHQGPVAQIQWYDNLAQRLGATVDPGNVAGLRWCTGTLIADNLFLTAGHCFDIDSNGWRTPRNIDRPLSPSQLAPLMKLNFGYQLPPLGDIPRVAVSFPIVRLIEHRLGKLDYAIVEVGKNEAGELPSKEFGVTPTNSSRAILETAKMLTIIQHPLGNPKKIAAGLGLSVVTPNITYSDVDTQGGASGAGVLDHRGNLIAVHVMGGCTSTNGANEAVSLMAIRAYSAVLQKLP